MTKKDKEVIEMEQILGSISSNESDLGNDLNILNNVYGDSSRFVQIIQNFLSNALKFTDKNGKIIIKVSLQEVQEIKSEEHKENYKLALEQNMNISADKQSVIKSLFNKNSKVLHDVEKSF